MKNGGLIILLCCAVLLAVSGCSGTDADAQAQLELTLPAMQSRLVAIDMQLNALATAVVAEQRLATAGLPVEMFITPSPTPANPFSTAVPENLPGEAGPTPDPQQQANPDDNPQAAAALAVESFFTVDYLEGFEPWAERLCALSTVEGCRNLRTLTGWNQWNLVYRLQRWQTVCQAGEVERVTIGQQDDIHWRVPYTVTGTCTGCSLPQSGEMVISLKLDMGVWKLDEIKPNDDLGGNKIPLPEAP